jgi:Holliday junction resolvasome RuvABC endonuclease subunit
VKTLGIDPGLSTGWCLFDGKPLSWGVWKIGKNTDDEYVYNLWLKLTELMGSESDVTLVISEEPVIRGKAGASMNRQVAVIQLVARLQEVNWYPVNPSSVKQFATTKGNATKDDMLLAAIETWNIEAEPDAIDAMWIAAYGHFFKELHSV